MPEACRIGAAGGARGRRGALRLPAVPPLAPIDLHHGSPRTVACYLLETPDGPALFDCGPATAVAALRRGLAERGLALGDVRDLFLSHIHLDHAGAAGVLVREHPALRVHVSAIGAPHLVDPRRLEASARRLYGDAFDGLWGELAPVPRANVHVAEGNVLGLEVVAAPGHASHHVVYLAPEGTLYAGDAAGVRILPGRFVLPPCPPPETDVEAWERTIEQIERRAPARLALIHFGVVEEGVDEHLARLRDTLRRWSSWVEDGMDEETFVAAARADVARLDPAEADTYGRAAPYWHCFRGLERYWRKRSERAVP